MTGTHKYAWNIKHHGITYPNRNTLILTAFWIKIMICISIICVLENINLAPYSAIKGLLCSWKPKAIEFG